MLRMKHIRGDIGYLGELKKREMIKAIIQWIMVIVFLLIGYFTTKTKLNLFTFVAILSCLPAAKTMVGVIVKWRYKPMDLETTNEIESYSDLISFIYHPILTSRDKVMGISCIAISGHTIFCYVTDKKTDKEYTTKYIKSILNQNKIEKTNVKILNDYVQFISRVEGLHNMLSISGESEKELEFKIRHTLILYSM